MRGGGALRSGGAGQWEAAVSGKDMQQPAGRLEALEGHVGR